MRIVVSQILFCLTFHEHSYKSCFHDGHVDALIAKGCQRRGWPARCPFESAQEAKVCR